MFTFFSYVNSVVKRGSGRIVNKASLANMPGVVERELVQAWEARKTTNTGAAIRQVVSSSVAISKPVGRLIVVEAQSVYLKAGAAYSCHVQAFKRKQLWRFLILLDTEKREKSHQRYSPRWRPWNSNLFHIYTLRLHSNTDWIDDYRLSTALMLFYSFRKLHSLVFTWLLSETLDGVELLLYCLLFKLYTRKDIMNYLPIWNSNTWFTIRLFNIYDIYRKRDETYEDEEIRATTSNSNILNDPRGCSSFIFFLHSLLRKKACTEWLTNQKSSGHEPDELTNSSTPLLPLVPPSSSLVPSP